MPFAAREKLTRSRYIIPEPSFKGDLQKRVNASITSTSNFNVSQEKNASLENKWSAIWLTASHTFCITHTFYSNHSPIIREKKKINAQRVNSKASQSWLHRDFQFVKPH